MHYLQHTGKMEYLRSDMVALNESCCSFYEVTDVDIQGVRLWDTPGKQEVPCWNSSGYSGRGGGIWYVRVLPRFVADSSRSVNCLRNWTIRICRHVVLNAPIAFWAGTQVIGLSATCRVGQWHNHGVSLPIGRRLSRQFLFQTRVLLAHLRCDLGYYILLGMHVFKLFRELLLEPGKGGASL